MSTRCRLLRTAGAAAALLAAATLPAQEKVPVFDKAYLTSKKNIELGRNVWETQCRHCHGAAA